jgi:PAS domain-containing protein
MHFLSNAYIAYNWNSSASSVFLSITGFVTEIPLPAYTGYVLSLLVLYGFFAHIVFSGVMHRYFGWTVPLSFLNILLLWIPSVFFIYLALPLVKMAFGCVAYSASDVMLHPFYPRMSCWSSEHSGHVFLSLLTLTLLLFVAVTTASFHFHRAIPAQLQPGDNAINSRSSNRAEAWLVLAKTVLLVLFVAGPSASWRVPMGLLLIATGAALAIYQLRTLPWWQAFAQTASVCQALILTWTGAVAVTMAALDDSEAAAMLYFVFLVPLCVASSLLVRWRYFTVERMPLSDITAPYLVDSKAKCLVRKYLKELASVGDGVYIEETSRVSTLREELHASLSQLFALSATRFPTDASVRLFAAQFHGEVAGNRILAFRELHSAQDLQLDYAQRFEAHRLRVLLNALQSKDSSNEVNRYLEFKARRDAAEQDLGDATRLLVQFWTELLTSRPDIEELASLGHRARAKLTSTQAHYERLLALNPSSVPTLREYGLVQLEILNDTGKAVELFEKADQIVSAKKQMLLECDHSDFLQRLDNSKLNVSVFDEDNAIVGVSVADGTMGMIENANPAFMRMFGLSRAVGKNINCVIPNPIRDDHNRYIADYLRTKRTRVVDVVRLVMGVHAQGHLLAFAMYVRWSDEARGRMLGVLQPLSNTHEICAMVDKQHRVLHATGNLHSVFGFSKRDIWFNNVSLPQILPVLAQEDQDAVDAAFAELGSATGLQCEAAHIITQQRFRTHAFLHRLRSYETDYFFFRCQISQIATREDGLTDADISDMDDVEDLRAACVLSANLSAPVVKQGQVHASAADIASDPANLAAPDSARSHASTSPRDRSSRKDANHDAFTACSLQSFGGGANRPAMPLLAIPVSALSHAHSEQPYGSDADTDADDMLEAKPLSARPSAAMSITVSHASETPPTDLVRPSSRASSHASSQHSRGRSDLAGLTAASVSRSGSREELTDDLLSPAQHADADANGLSINGDGSRSESFLGSAPAPIAIYPAVDAHALLTPPTPSHARKPSQGVASADEKEHSAAGPSSSTSSGTRRKRNNRNRLQKAIENDNNVTMSRLMLLRVFSVGLCVALIAIGITMFILSEMYLDKSTVLLANTLNSARRTSYMSDIVTHLRFAGTFMRNREGTSLITDFIAKLYFKPRRQTSLDYAYLMDNYMSSTAFSLDQFRDLSNTVDGEPSSSTKLAALRNTPSVFGADERGWHVRVPVDGAHARRRDALLRGRLRIPRNAGAD